MNGSSGKLGGLEELELLYRYVLLAEQYQGETSGWNYQLLVQNSIEHRGWQQNIVVSK